MTYHLENAKHSHGITVFQFSQRIKSIVFPTHIKTWSWHPAVALLFPLGHQGITFISLKSF